MSGPGVFAVAARAKIERAAVRLSIASSILVVTLLLAVYRSLPALALGLLPVATGALIGVAAVALGFRRRARHHPGIRHHADRRVGRLFDLFLHSVAPAGAGPAAGSSWQRAWWPTIRLGMLTSVCGFASLLPSGFPGLAQLGAVLDQRLDRRRAGDALLCCRRCCRPDFAIRDVAPFGRAHRPRLLRPTRRLRRRQLLAAAAAGACRAAIAILLSTSRRRCGIASSAALSPVSAQDQDYDAQLRADLGAADVRDLVIVSGPTLESALRGAERAARALETLGRCRKSSAASTVRRTICRAWPPRRRAATACRAQRSCATTCGRPPLAWA